LKDTEDDDDDDEDDDEDELEESGEEATTEDDDDDEVSKPWICFAFKKNVTLIVGGNIFDSFCEFCFAG
jgi:hypothetical protein